MRSITKKSLILTMGLGSYVLGLFVSSVLHRQGNSGHFAGGFLIGLAIVLLVGAVYQQRHAPHQDALN